MKGDLEFKITYSPLTIKGVGMYRVQVREELEKKFLIRQFSDWHGVVYKVDETYAFRIVWSGLDNTKEYYAMEDKIEILTPSEDHARTLCKHYRDKRALEIRQGVEGVIIQGCKL